MSTNTNEQKAVFVCAIRKSDHDVDVTYRMPDTGDKFTVNWSNIHPETGHTESSYDLDVDVRSDNETLAERVSEAIKAGESDDNTDIDLYLTVRDSFDATDVVEVKELLTEFESQYHSSQKHSSNNMSEYVRHNADIFNEVNGLQAIYQNAEHYHHGDYSLPSTKFELSGDGGTDKALLLIDWLDEDELDAIDDNFIKELNCDHINTKEAVIETYWALKLNNRLAEVVGDCLAPDEITWADAERQEQDAYNEAHEEQYQEILRSSQSNHDEDSL